jgi:TrfA protein
MTTSKGHGMNEQPLTRELAEVVERLRRTLEAKKEAATPETPQNAPKPQAKVVHLPFWNDEQRGTPNCFLRSALFAAIYGNSSRRYLKNAVLAVQGDITIRYTGEQLSQSDLDLVMAALHLARQHPLGHICHFRSYAFLKAIGRSDSKPNYLWLDTTITRLIACAVKIRLGQRVFEGSILSSCIRDEGSDVYKLTFDPNFVKLFGASDWTAIDWNMRRKLGRSPLAQWVYDYAVSHVGTKIKLKTLQKLSGRESDTPKIFNKAVRRAQEMLENAVAATIEIDDTGLVTITHKLSPSQLRHTARRS